MMDSNPAVSERGVHTHDKDPDLCGPEGMVYAPDALSLGGNKNHPLIAGTKVHLLTFGCQMNKYDSAMVAGLLNEKGAGFVENDADADLLIMNTCSVRGHAEDRVYSRIGSLRERKKENPGFIIAVMGCMAQKESEQIQRRFPFVDLIVGTRMLSAFPQLLERVRQGAPTPLIAIDENPIVNFGETLARRENHSQAFLTITRGCNKRCTYCVVPYTRGPEVSRSIADIQAEAQRLANDGVREITLLGQTIDSYGHDLNDGSSLSKLLQVLHPIKNLERVRFITSHPEECREDLWKTMADLGDKVMPFIHMPAQSGSDRMLQRMARGYTRKRYLDVVETASKYCPEIEIASDWIVGFTGETDEDFQQSLDLMKEFRPQTNYIFKYSVREGTPAQRLPDDVSEELKKERHTQMKAVTDQLALDKYQSRIGQIEHVLVETASKNNAERLTGRGRTHKLVHFPGPLEWAGQLKKVKITDATALCLIGEVVD